MTRRARVGVAVIVAVGLVVAAVVVMTLWPRTAAGPRSVSGIGVDLSHAQLEAAAQQRLDAVVEACTRPATEIPEACGFRIPWAADLAEVDGIRFRVEEPPTLAVTLPTFHADGGVLVATLTGTGTDGESAAVTYRTEDWMLRGDVTVKNAGVVLSVW